MNFSILGNGRISRLINGWPFVEIMTTIHFSKIAQMFATLRNLSICISVNEWNLNSIRICCYFGLHLGWWTKLLNWVQEIFHLFPKLSKRRSCDREFLNSRELNASTTMKPPQIPSSTIRRAFSNSLLPQLFPKFPASTTIIKTWVKPLPRQNKYLINIVYALDTRFRAKKRHLNFIYASRRNPTKNWRVYQCWNDAKFDCHL